MRPKYYSIPKPCSEDWNKMTPTEQGAFCAKCTKEVLDCSSVKTSKIKALIDERKDPCVRIFQSQIDEMNFFEWFNTLTLRKQLKYLFLFAFLFVFNSFGQDSSSATDTPPITEQIEIDSIDNIPDDDLVEDFETIEEPYPVISVFDPGILIADVIFPEIMGGAILVEEPFFYGDIAIEPYIIPEVEGVPFQSLEVTVKDEEANITNSNYISVDHNNYSFFIEEDTLIFHANAREETMVRIKIKEKESNEIIFFDPIGIPEGQREVHFPLDEFKNGAYIIILEGDAETKAIELMYW